MKKIAANKIHLITIFQTSFEPYNICRLQFPNGMKPNVGMRLNGNHSIWQITRIALTMEGTPSIDIVQKNSEKNIWDCSLKKVDGKDEIANCKEFSVEEQPT